MKNLALDDYKKTKVEDVLKMLRSSEAGLTEKEAAERLKNYGPNEIHRKKRLSPIFKFFSYFKNPLIIILIIAALVSEATGETKNFVIIMVMIFLSVILNFYQEHKSGKAAEKIAKKLTVTATVIREAREKEIQIKYLVPGDIISLSAGDIIPADGMIISADDFFFNESALTGESFPVEKITRDHGDNLVYSGTNVISGYARVIIIKTGAETEYGNIAERLVRQEEPSAFEIGIKRFGFLIAKIILILTALIFLINAWNDKNLVDSLVFSIAVAVGITPELLPMIMSVNMSKGSIAMSKKGVIVKRLNAIPNFGSMDILCTDKTGTLTEDKITIVKYIDPRGKESPETLRLAYINGSLETGIKSILDKTILDFKNISLKGVKKIDEIPYDFIRKRSSIIFKEKNSTLMATKGAPEEIFKICSSYYSGGKEYKNSPEAEKKIVKLYEEMSRQGFRVLGVARKLVPSGKKIYAKSEETAMTLLGFIAFYDPPKKDVKETIALMEQHGIEIKILTGDSPLVTKKICADLKIKIKGILSGEELDINKLDDKALAVRAQKNTIFARLSPSQKEKIIEVLRKSGKVVGYLGDGINDSPALLGADVGISVDNAVDVAKETADIILLKKSLRVLLDGVIEGRKTFGNTMKYMMMGLSSNFGNMFSMVGAVIFLPFFPMLPGQILLNNFLYDTSQLSIPSDKVDPEYLRKPKHWNISFIKKFMLVFGPVSSLFDFLTFFFLYSIFHLSGSNFQTGWFIESLATQVFVIYIIRTRKIPFLQSRPSSYLLITTLGIVVAGTMIATTPLAKIFGFSPLPAGILMIVFGLVIIYLLLVEMVKRAFYRKYGGEEQRI